jgi:small subunit ribosomal protein S19
MKKIKIPFVLESLKTQVKNTKKPKIKTWSRSSTILPSWLNKTIYLHNGKKFDKIFIVEDIVGYKLGEFQFTRKKKVNHKKKK